MRYFDPHHLRTFVTFAETGTLAQAAQVVGRTPSAVTTQMQRLEETAGLALFQNLGRRRILTTAGEQFLPLAKRILQENQEAYLKMTGIKADGHISLGVTQDFVDQSLPFVLKKFVQSHPNVRLDFNVARSAELLQSYNLKKIDILLSLRQNIEDDEVGFSSERMHWICAHDGFQTHGEELPLAVLDPPCGFRDATLKALEETSQAYRLVATSPSLAGIEAAVKAGLALTVRTQRWINPDLSVAPKNLSLPDLPMANFSIRVHKEAGLSARSFAQLLLNDLNFLQSN